MNNTNIQPNVVIQEPGTVRITVSIPAVVNMFLKKRVPKRQVSQFVADAIAEKIPVYVAENSKNSYLRKIIELRKKIKHPMTTKEIKAAINKGRL
jgi:hypothetical protein